jgi:hypothetical protein
MLSLLRWEVSTPKLTIYFKIVVDDRTMISPNIIFSGDELSSEYILMTTVTHAWRAEAPLRNFAPLVLLTSPVVHPVTLWVKYLA